MLLKVIAFLPGDCTDPQVQNILDLKQRIKDLKARKKEIEKAPKYQESLTSSTPSTDCISLMAERISILQQLNGSRRKKIKGLTTELNEAINVFSQSLVGKQRVFLILDRIQQQDEQLADDITSYLMQYKNFYRQALSEEIRRLYAVPAELPLHVMLKEGGASKGFVVRFNGITVYVKESMTYSASDKKINPKELFVYKVLEHAHFGPKTKFILKSYTTTGRSGARIGYITTMDVEHTKFSAEKSKQFTVDLFTLDEDDPEIEAEWVEAFADEAFRSELLSLSMLDDVLLLQDTFQDNPGNYGVLKITGPAGLTRYKPRLIDHLPYSRRAETNGYTFCYTSRKDAQANFERKVLGSKRKHESRGKSTICGNLVEREPISFSTVAGNAYERLVTGKQGKASSSIQDAVRLAYEEISSLVQTNPTVFIESAQVKLAEYMAKIKGNLAVLSAVFDSEP
jgi:hypothetical protein